MAAPDIPTIYDFETNFEDAVVPLIEAALSGLTPAFTVYQTLDGADVQTPFVAVMASVGAAEENDMFVTSLDAKEYHRYGLQLVLEVVTDVIRADENQRAVHADARARIRNALRASADHFTAVNLPHYQVVYMKPEATQILADGDAIRSVLTFQVRFLIKASAWPSA